MRSSEDVWDEIQETVPTRFHRLIAQFGESFETEGYEAGVASVEIPEPVPVPDAETITVDAEVASIESVIEEDRGSDE